MNDLDDRLDEAATDVQRAVSLMSLTTTPPAPRRSMLPVWRLTVISTAVMLVFGSIYLARSRDTAPQTTSPATSTIVSEGSPHALPAYAVLTGDIAAHPSSMREVVEGSPTSDSPKVDIWQQDTTTLIIRTVTRASTVEPTDTSTQATIAAANEYSEPWGQRDVTPVRIRGVAGATATLADDQHVVWIPNGEYGYTVVIGRGMTNQRLIATVEALVNVNGVLEPQSGFTVVDRYPASAVATPSPPFAQISYSLDAGPWVESSLVPQSHTSIETAPNGLIGRLEHINNNDVLIVNDIDRTLATWLAPNGVEVTIIALGARNDMTSLIESVRMIDATEWQQTNARLSEQIARQVPETGRSTLDGVTLIRRADGASQALCLITDGNAEVCARQPSVVSEGPGFIAAQTQIDGHWLIFGYDELGPNESPDNSMDTVTFTDQSGTTTRPAWTNDSGANWYVARIPDTTNSVDTNLGIIAGGIVGTVTRPIVTAALQ